jgi:hypothetical protein
MSPSSVLALCSELYSKEPDAFLLSIKGYSWEFGKEMSDRAKENLDKALIFLNKILKDPSNISSPLRIIRARETELKSRRKEL